MSVTTDQQGQAPQAYASAAPVYLAAGWTCVIPVPAEAKYPPPEGFTGAGGKDTTPGDVAAFAASSGSHSVALRMPAGVIGIDVDEYAKGGTVKHGQATLEARIAEWGPLPPTYSSTARGAGQPSRIYFYRVPEGRYAGVLGPDVEVIQRHHRYAVVWPSVHPQAGSAYQWYSPSGTPLELNIPRPEDLAGLPARWVEGLAAGASRETPLPAGEGEGHELLSRIAARGGEPCIDMARIAAQALSDLGAAAAGSRHDKMLAVTWNVIMLAAEGHPGAAGVLGQLQERWEEVTAGEGREAEFSGALLDGARKAVTKTGSTVPVNRDPCLMINAAPWQAPHPDGGTGGAPPAIEPERLWSPFGEIGTDAFDPQSDMDALLARDVLHRLRPVLRYAPDTGTWLVRGPEYWDARAGEQARWGVDLVSWLMLPGDPGADPGTADGLMQIARAKRRARFMSNAGAGGIAGKMHAQVMAGHHPSTTEMAALDSDREILWAGGIAYDLRESTDGPAFATAVDPGTPHLRSAAVMPDKRATPLWDAFIAAVWPDPELRGWALRVLSVAVTGYADKILPILLGDTDRGKTQVVMLMSSVLGSYAHIADARLLAPADKSHASIVAALKGRRLSFIDEAPRTGSLATERLKQITGGADLTGNEMRANPVTFSPTHTLILTANRDHEPKLTDGAVASRVRLIPCDGDPALVKLTRAAIGSLASPGWRAEAPGVLAFLMSEAARWLDDPGTASNAAAPRAGLAAVEQILAEQDSIAQDLEEELEPWPEGTRGRELYMGFTERQRRLNVHPAAIPSETAYGRRLTELGYPPEHRRDGKYRALRPRPRGGWAGLMPVPAPATNRSTPPDPAEAPPVTEPVPGQARHAEPENADPTPTRHADETAGQAATVSPIIYGGDQCDGSHNINNAYTHTYTHTQNVDGDESQPETRHPEQPPRPGNQDPPESRSVTAAGAEAAPAAGPGSPLVPEPGSPLGPDSGGGGAKPARAKRARRTPEEAAAARAAQAAERARVRDAERAAKLRAAEGAIVPLPAIVARVPQGPPAVAACSLEEARLIAGQYPDGLCVDVEHTGYSPGRTEYALRLVQLGGEQAAVVLDPDDPAQREVIRDVLAQARVLHAHSAIADLIPLAMAGLADADSLWARMVDSVLIAKLADPSLAGSDESKLKELSADLLGAYAVSKPAEAAKNELFKAGGWLMQTTAQTPVERSGWAQVRKDCETFIRYAGCDVLDLAAVIRVLPRPEGSS